MPVLFKMLVDEWEALQMDDKTQRQLIRLLAQRLKESWKELEAHRMTLNMLMQMGVPGVERLLESSRNSADLRDAVVGKFARLDDLLPDAEAITDAHLFKVLEEFQAKEKD
jgi:hypothetical protein